MNFKIEIVAEELIPWLLEKAGLVLDEKHDMSLFDVNYSCDAVLEFVFEVQPK